MQVVDRPTLPYLAFLSGVFGRELSGCWEGGVTNLSTAGMADVTIGKTRTLGHASSLCWVVIRPAVLLQKGVSAALLPLAFLPRVFWGELILTRLVLWGTY